MSGGSPGSARRIAAIAIIFGLIVATVVVWVAYHKPGPGEIANDALISESSLAHGSIVRQVTNSQDGSDLHRGWRSNAQTTGAWIQFSWSSLHRLQRIAIERNPLNEPGATAGYLVFGDGSQLQVRLSTVNRTTVIPFTPRSVDSLRFVVTATSPGARSVAISRVHIYDKSHPGGVATGHVVQGDAATAATISSTAGSSTTLARLIDGNLATASTLAGPDKASITLNWKQPRELKSVSVAGASSSASMISGTLTFSDGTQLTVGTVSTDPRHPTTVSFMPKVTSRLRLTIDAVSGGGGLALAEISADQLDAPPRVPAGAAAAESNGFALSCPAPSPRPSAGVGFVVQCPLDGSQVADTVPLQLTVAAGYTSVRIQVTPSDLKTPLPPAIQSVPAADGTATVPLDLHALPVGPFAVEITATGPGLKDQLRILHLDKQTGAKVTTSSVAAPRSGPAMGRSLVFDDEFSRAPDISESGNGTDYASSKPTATGDEDFGAAIFAPPSAHLGNDRVVDNSYLKLSVEPRPANYPDPAGYGRDFVGALLSSAGTHGTGFSAQYGYFEARILAPAGLGTWPAFWMLPSSILDSEQSVVAEIDAVELYGTVPKGSCSSTHQFANGVDGGVAHCGNRWVAPQEARWHTYGVSIEPTGVQFYIDGSLIATAAQVEGGSEPMFFMLDLALGGGWPVNLDSTQGLASLYVDYVRVYV